MHGLGALRAGGEEGALPRGRLGALWCRWLVSFGRRLWAAIGVRSQLRGVGWVVGSWGGSPWSLRGGEAVEDGGFGFLAVGGVGALDDFHGGEGGPVLEVGGALQEVAAVALRLEEDLEQAGVEGVAGSADAELDRGAGSEE